ncbi:DNA-binding MarR family transcriptional regulator [Psychromicrobium silvestre]|uniref:DNA-binding MarR family transcriptional regulator n=1 Tax=Psychromicrobium silvestre TaxID=1645614 RepID=A0A7Y9LUZ3_9MICC|nr:MarR family transcriptional regulator [Psychromicrobium silvestre]NYE96117.1 DNA-binding MarR family transcriptional regulator [Psychromicrobium silvestre]
MRQAERIRYLLLAAQREGNRQLAAALRAIGLTPEQSEVLRILGDHGDLSIKGVGLMLVCDSGTNPSRLVERLVQAGLVERNPDPADRRKMQLALTAEGRLKEQQTRSIEDAMYAQIDLLPGGAELAATLELIVSGRPAGEALRRRIG